MKVIVTKLAFFNGRRVRKGERIEYPLKKGENLPAWRRPAEPIAPQAAAKEAGKGGDGALV